MVDPWARGSFDGISRSEVSDREAYGFDHSSYTNELPLSGSKGWSKFPC